MGLLGGLLARESRSLENPNVPISGIELAGMIGGSFRTASGTIVTEETALRQITVVACQRIIAETIATLPLGCFVKQSQRVERLPVPRWLVAPNPDIDGPELVEDLLFGMLSNGNGFSQIIRDRREDVVELYPLQPNLVQMERLRSRDPMKYMWTDLDGSMHTDFGPPIGRNILHVRAWRRPGQLRGISPIEKHRQAIGAGLAQEQYGAAFFGNGAQAGGIIEHPTKMSREAAQILVDTWRREHGGLANAHRPGVLTEGAQWKQMSITPEQAQFLDTQKFTVAQIARMYRVPPHLVGDVEKSTSWGTGIEEQNIAFVTFTLLPWISRLERVLTALLRLPGETDGPYIKFDVRGLLRGSLKDRYEAYAIGRAWGWESPNSVLRREDEEPIEGGDTYLVPLNHGSSSDVHVRPLRDRAQGAYFLGQSGIPPEFAAQIMEFDLTDEQLAGIQEAHQAAAVPVPKAPGVPTDGTEPLDPKLHPDDQLDEMNPDGPEQPDEPDPKPDDKPGSKP